MFASLLACPIRPANAQNCLTLTAEVRAKLAAYVSDRYEVAPDVKVDDDGVAGGSCFRRLTVRVSAPSRTLTLFLSPDQRFLADTLLDTTVSPAGERRRAAHQTESALLAEKSPFLGPPNAGVTLVVFSDFECPFCKRFQEMLVSVSAKDRQNVKVTFKHRPLAMHPWARQAALESICASYQSDEAFWLLHDFFFSNQSAFTPGNLGEKVAAFASAHGEIDLDRIRACVGEADAGRTLLRDEQLAQAYHIEGVPTVFINGVRTVGVHSAEELVALLRAAAGDQASDGASARVPGSELESRAGRQ